MKRFSTLIFLLLVSAVSIFLVLSARASDCSPIRFDWLKERKSFPVTSQRVKEGSCFLHAGASMYAAFLHSRNEFTEQNYFDPNQIFQELEAEPEKVKNRFLSATRGRTCGAVEYIAKSRGVEAPKCKQFDFVNNPSSPDPLLLRSPKEFKKEMHRLLDEKSGIPIAIEYCAGVLTSGDGDYILKRAFPKNIDFLNPLPYWLNYLYLSQFLSNQCRFHSSVLIGRERKEDGKCYFLIQNSWGESCDSYADKSLCEGGKIWVKEEVLAKNILRIAHLE